MSNLENLNCHKYPLFTPKAILVFLLWAVQLLFLYTQVVVECFTFVSLNFYLEIIINHSLLILTAFRLIGIWFWRICWWNLKWIHLMDKRQSRKWLMRDTTVLSLAYGSLSLSLSHSYISDCFSADIRMILRFWLWQIWSQHTKEMR